MSELPKQYDPKTAEPRWYAEWLEGGAFGPRPDGQGAPYTIVIPPPNVTGVLHMGHALNNTIQDVLIRWKRMQGFDALWIPGTDHAGIATQNVVERELKKEGRTRQDLGRDAFLERVWTWKQDKGDTISRQLKTIGSSCDWSRERFTMDEGLSRAVKEAFVRLFDKGLIYRGEYIINWCPRCSTALSDEESEHRAMRGKLYHLRYPVVGRPGEFAVVATTRPETMLGDTAVAANPADPRYQDWTDRQFELPILGRRIPLIRDDFVDPAFGTGLVKVTPAHDPNDFQMGLRHDLPRVSVMDERGTMNEQAGPYAGLDRIACRKKLVADLEAAGLVERIEDHDHAVGHCYRCHTMVEPRLSKQWFVRMKPLAEPAIRAVRDGEVRFIPERWGKVYLEWMDNIRDWCISRQIWWGHRIPVFYCDRCGHTWADRGQPEHCPKCTAGGVRQDDDVLDTWFSSWLWPFSVFGWPDKTPDLLRFYPTTSLSTASEILFFWVARMVMAGCEFMGRPPFREVYIHGTVRDDQGRKMSKSLGNSIDPLTIVEKFSADALRSSLMMLTATGQDVYISDSKFEIGRNFGTKVWNAARYLQMQSPEIPAHPESPELDPARLSSDDQHLLLRLNEAIATATAHLEAYRFNDYALSLHDFVWHQFCDWYVEYSKGVFGGADPARAEQVRCVMHYALSTALRLLHPLMPFETSELWTGLGYARGTPSLLRAAWPDPQPDAVLKKWGATPETAAWVDDKRELIRNARTLRAERNLPPRQRVAFTVAPASKAWASRLETERETIAAAIGAEPLNIEAGFDPGGSMPGAVCRLGSVFMSIEGLVDASAERAKLQAQLDEAQVQLSRVEAKLGNVQFTSKAPPAVVAQQEARRAELADTMEKLKARIAGLK